MFTESTAYNNNNNNAPSGEWIELNKTPLVNSVNGQTGDVMIPFGYSNTAANVAEKVITLEPAIT